MRGPTKDGRHRRRVVAALLLPLALSACQGGTAAAPVGAPSGATPSATPSAAPSAPTPSRAHLTVLPADAATGVRPDEQVIVTATGGTLGVVRVTDAKGATLAGTTSTDGRTWTSSGPLALDARYTVRAAAVDEARRGTASTTGFRTLATAKLLHTSVSPLRGTTVGVGMPVIVKLNHAVTDRAAVQRALVVTTTPAVEGSWSWQSDQELQYRPREFWPADTDISLAVGLDGVDAGNGVWGDEQRTVAFRTGSAMVSTVDVVAKRLTVTRDGKVLRVIPVTTGKPGFLTRGGTKVISEKYRSKVMDAATGGTSKNSPDYYRLTVQYALRVTWSGEFLHAAPWSVGSQGEANVSHGCVGMSMADGKWFYDQSKVGDVVRVVGSPRTIEAGNGWTAWNVPWETWVAGSAQPA